MLILSLAIILIAANLGGFAAAKLGQAPVLGELGAGVVLGNLNLIGFSRLDYLGADSAVDLFARLGVVLLLFQVGLESSVSHMRRVGRSSVLAALFGISGSFVLGWMAAAWLLPTSTPYTSLFVAASLTATSNPRSS